MPSVQSSTNSVKSGSRREPSVASKDPYRVLFLRQVRQIITSAKPGAASLYQLLRIINPELSIEDIENSQIRKRFYFELKARILQDGNENDATRGELCYQLTKFYDACLLAISSPPPPSTILVFSDNFSNVRDENASISSASTPSCPPEFSVHENWPHVTFSHPVSPNMDALAAKRNLLDIYMAYKCINARGSIVHGAKPGLFFGWHKVEQDALTCVNAGHLFSDKFKGARRLVGVEAIKQELISRGPVISTSFILSPGLANSLYQMEAFLKERVAENHPVIIVGWEQTPSGELWIVRACGDASISIAFGEFKIDDVCIAPVCNLEDISWQSGPFLDLDVSNWPNDWMTWTSPEFLLTSRELEKLSECFVDGFMTARGKASRFVVRNQSKHAQCRVWYLENIKWIPSSQRWKVKAALNPFRVLNSQPSV